MPLHHEQPVLIGRRPGVNRSTSTAGSSKPNGRAHANGKAHHYNAAPFDLAVDPLATNGYSAVGLIGKRPIDDDWPRWCKAPPTPDEIATHKGRNLNVGVACGYNGTVGIDIDTDRPEIEAAIRRVIPASPVAKRGKRGRTDFGRTSKPIASRRFYGPDGEILVEVLGDGRQSAIPPSIHPDIQRPYEWLSSATLLNTPLADLPLWPDDIGERLRMELAPFLAPEKEPRPQRSGPPPILTDTMRKRHRAWALKAIGTRVKELAGKQKPGRNRELFNIVCTFGKHVHHGVVTDAELRKPVLAACDTNGIAKANGWHDCEKTVDNGLRYALSDVLEDLSDRPKRQKTSAKPRREQRQQEDSQPQAELTKDEAVAKLAAESFDKTELGGIAKNERNIRRCLAKAGITLRYDAFARQRIVGGLSGYGPDLSDGAIDAMWIGFEREYKARFKRDHFAAVLRVEAHANTFHPVRDYLAGLKWDGTPRLDKWLTTYAGAKDTELIQQFGRLTLIGAVRRVRHPGTKFDTMLVLEGSEGRGKSTLFEKLAGHTWFSDDAPLNSEARETIERLRGKWIIEAADLSAVKRTDVERLKAFLARSKDSATMKYERETTTAPRECIFVGTTNSAAYLQSKNGNRRFWPVKVGKVDIPQLQHDSDHLWAEAAHYEAAGASVVLPEELWPVAREEQEKRREGDEWEGVIAEWLDGRRTADPFVTTADVAATALSVQLRDLDGRAQTRITDAMRLAGWSKDAGKTVRGKRYWGPVDGSNG